MTAELRTSFRFKEVFYVRNKHDDIVHTGDAALLATLLHAKGKSRESKDMNDVLHIMKDANVLADDAQKQTKNNKDSNEQ